MGTKRRPVSRRPQHGLTPELLELLATGTCVDHPLLEFNYSLEELEELRVMYAPESVREQRRRGNTAHTRKDADR
ncbi:MAG: hypothetical protein FJW22_09810 [Acidimicrobiia bacterium]|nr:hypothetical protein [Acidimicrobiia bacterium]